MLHISFWKVISVLSAIFLAFLFDLTFFYFYPAYIQVFIKRHKLCRKMLLHCWRLKNVCSCRCICIYDYSYMYIYIYSSGSGSESESGWCLSEWALAGVDIYVHVECFIFQPLRFLFTVYFFSQHFEWMKVARVQRINEWMNKRVSNWTSEWVTATKNVANGSTKRYTLKYLARWGVHHCVCSTFAIRCITEKGN